MLMRAFTRVGPLLSGKMPMRDAKILGGGDAHSDPAAWWAPAKVSRCIHFKTAAEQAISSPSSMASSGLLGWRQTHEFGS